MSPHPKTWVEISGAAVSANISALKNLLSPETAICAVVKANAYGHDLETMVRLASTSGIRFFAVDNLEEALHVRSRFADAEVIILGYAPLEWAETIVANHFIQTVYNQPLLDALSDAALKLRDRARINLKIETGTHRQGIEVKKLWGFLRGIRQLERTVEFSAISSHFADAETPGSSYSAYQMGQYQEALLLIKEAGLPMPLRHFACSAAVILDPTTHFDLVRLGIALYGIWPSEETRRANRVRQNAIDLHPVLTWKTCIAQIKDLQPGDLVSYGMRYRADRPMRMAVLPVGYADGYRRSNTGKAEVLVHGHLCPVIGTICMNMMMIDVSQLPTVKEGDTVTLLGRDGMHQISAEDIAAWTGTIPYEVVTQINPLLQRLVV
ncbi:MAG: alanine racemase [Patescibacteria group bacterium]|jgi:alanine racemase